MTRWIAIACLLAFGIASAEPQPYAGQQTADIKALTAEDQASLLAGTGMGFAKAAELNGYPGPKHVLELATRLELSSEQVARTRALFERMQTAARAAGARLIDEERRLDRLYASRAATADAVDAQLARIEATRKHLRGIHLNAHLEQTALLSRHQLALYAQLRGYGGAEHRHDP